MAQLYKQYNVAAIGESADSADHTVSESANSSLKMLNWIKNKCLHNYINYQTQLDDRFVFFYFIVIITLCFNVNIYTFMKITC